MVDISDTQSSANELMTDALSPLHTTVTSTQQGEDSKHAARSISCSLNCHKNSPFFSSLQSSDSTPRRKSLTSPCPSKLATLTCATDSKFRPNTVQVRQWRRFKIADKWSKCKLLRCSCSSAFFFLLLLGSSRLRHQHYPGKQHLWLLLTCSFHWQEAQCLPVFCVSHDSQISQFDF